jgi:hypothetical protein
MTKKMRTEMEKSFKRQGYFKLPSGDYIVQFDDGQCSLRNGETLNTITVGSLRDVLEICE